MSGPAGGTPAISIILPTFNRRDTLGRAIDSIRQQSFADWELIVVDDGSTDGTAESLAGIDPRVRVVRQENQGCYAARNAGIGLARGRLITFMDSDDAWLPHHLEIAIGFFRASPGDHVLLTEFFEDWGGGPDTRHDWHEAAHTFPRMAKQVGSRMLDLPPGEVDDYLRIYSTREPLDAETQKVATRAGYPEAALYRGQIFEYLRFGHLGWLPTTIVTREAVERVGAFLPHYRTAADYRFLGLLFRNYRANMISIPTAVKHSLAPSGETLAEGHLATGAHEYRFAVHRLPLYDEFFWTGRETDDELRRVRGLYQWYAGRVGAQLGKRQEAIQHLDAACASIPPLWSGRLLRWWMQVAPSDRVATEGYRGLLAARGIAKDVAGGRLSPADFVRKTAKRLARLAGAG